jgi:hypothetical protein
MLTIWWKFAVFTVTYLATKLCGKFAVVGAPDVILIFEEVWGWGEEGSKISM